MKLQKFYSHSLSTLVITAVISTFITLTVVYALILPALYGLDADDLARLFKKHLVIQDDVVAGRNSPPDQSTTTLRTVAPSAVPIYPTQDSVIEERHHLVTLTVLPGQQLNYWLAMERDYQLDYSWHTDGKPLVSEFRGERDKSSTGKDETFKKVTKAEAGGLFISPFAGKFGWLWLNKTKQPIQVHLSVKGEFEIVDELT